MKMKFFYLLFLFCVFFLFSNNTLQSVQQDTQNNIQLNPVITQVLLDPNNISTWFISTGIFNQDLRTTNTPGLMWPKGSNKFSIFTTGLTIAAKVNGNLRMAAASFKGEYVPGYIVDSSGIPVARTDSRYKLYKVTPSGSSDPDWLNWGYMVPYGAPFTDNNHNGIYEPAVDIPGYPNSDMTIFLCMTDGFSSSHNSNEGFGGGTLPLFAEVHMTAWAYNALNLENCNFVKWEVINKSHTPWNSTYISIVCDPDLGCSDDDYIACDTVRQLGICYNGDDDDAGCSYGYGVHPPAVGIDLLQCSINRSVNPPKTLGMTSFTFFNNSNSPGPVCEQDPIGDPQGAYNFMKGLKKDQTPWVIPPGGSTSLITKYTYPGDPETGSGWTEGTPGGVITGSVENCGGPNVLTGTIRPINQPGDRRFLINSGADNFTVSPGESQILAIGQIVSRGSNNLQSVTKLKNDDNAMQSIYNIIGVENISQNVPAGYVLYQNYPNPFNPITTIKFSLPNPSEGRATAPLAFGEGLGVRLIIYDIIGREISVLVNDVLKPGSYQVKWDASGFASGIYYYKLVSSDYSQTKKMVLIK